MFRAWDNKKKEWLLGYELPNLGGFSLFGEVMMMGEWAELLSSRFPNEIEEIEVSQFTGLLDKNGKEIYEGDVVRFGNLGDEGTGEYRLGTVEWCNTCCAGFRLQWSGFGNNERLGTQENIEIVGNIYESPELLTGLNQEV